MHRPRRPSARAIHVATDAVTTIRLTGYALKLVTQTPLSGSIPAKTRGAGPLDTMVALTATMFDVPHRSRPGVSASGRVSLLLPYIPSLHLALTSHRVDCDSLQLLTGSLVRAATTRSTSTVTQPTSAQRLPGCSSATMITTPTFTPPGMPVVLDVIQCTYRVAAQPI